MDFFDDLCQGPQQQRIRISRMAKAADIPQLTKRGRRESSYRAISASKQAPGPFARYFTELQAHAEHLIRIYPTKTVFSFQYDSSTILTQVEALMQMEKRNQQYVDSIEVATKHEVLQEIQGIGEDDSVESSYDSLFQEEKLEPLTPFREFSLTYIIIAEQPTEEFDINNLKTNEQYTQSVVAMLSRIIDAGRSYAFAKLLKADTSKLGGCSFENSRKVIAPLPPAIF